VSVTEDGTSTTLVVDCQGSASTYVIPHCGCTNGLTRGGIGNFDGFYIPPRVFPRMVSRAVIGDDDVPLPTTDVGEFSFPYRSHMESWFLIQPDNAPVLFKILLHNRSDAERRVRLYHVGLDETILAALCDDSFVLAANEGPRWHLCTFQTTPDAFTDPAIIGVVSNGEDVYVYAVAEA
jgi:hypothetical protein